MTQPLSEQTIALVKATVPALEAHGLDIVHETDISQMAPKRRPIEGKVAVWEVIVQPDFRVLALSVAS